MSARRMTVFLAALALGGAWGSKAFADSTSGISGNIDGLLGVKVLKNSDWDPVDRQVTGGALADFRGQTWPVSVAVNFLTSGDKHKRNGVDIKGSTFELGLGVRKVFDNLGIVAPFVGGGAALVGASLESQTGLNGGTLTTSDNDRNIGGWVDGGVLVRVSSLLNVGFALHYTKASVKLFNNDMEAGGLTYGIMGGVHF